MGTLDEFCPILLVIDALGERKIQILLTDENVLIIICLDSTLDSKIRQKSRKILKISSFLQEFFKNKCISFFDEIWGYLLKY